ncbi:hypothetical protein ME3_01295 [Bartonella melophagi K-2C]|uniref:Uncharacterized protein n=1 Tax=Bartonella melophagi K-2C TaxID=1094557 RepID=J1JSA2_9HYPH|nr:hypothetical protein [Bartonella melophagi]EJF87742.1 hypothetical protein ME3_01295 [Bartonella melophagi K-2C]
MKNSKNLEVILPNIVVRWESLSTTQKQEILMVVEDITYAVPSTKRLKLQASSYLQMKPKL